MKYVNPYDKQSLLHRASLACRHDNVSLLLEWDEELANMQDKAGNTALHLACGKAGSKVGRLTVQALLVSVQEQLCSTKEFLEHVGHTHCSTCNHGHASPLLPGVTLLHTLQTGRARDMHLQSLPLHSPCSLCVVNDVHMVGCSELYSAELFLSND